MARPGTHGTEPHGQESARRSVGAEMDQLPNAKHGTHGTWPHDRGIAEAQQSETQTARHASIRPGHSRLVVSLESAKIYVRVSVGMALSRSCFTGDCVTTLQQHSRRVLRWCRRCPLPASAFGAQTVRWLIKLFPEEIESHHFDHKVCQPESGGRKEGNEQEKFS